MTHLQQFSAALQEALLKNTFVKINMANYKGTTEELKNCYIKSIEIKHVPKLSFTYRYKTKDIIKNYELNEAQQLIAESIAIVGFKQATLFTTSNDYVLDIMPNNKTTFKTHKPTTTQLLTTEHNLQKNRKITTNGKAYLHHLKITDAYGTVNTNAQDKYKQINHYIELLAPLLKKLSAQEALHVVDMGAGKGYLTFALYDYLTHVCNMNATIVGVEYRKDLVQLCNTIATQCNMAQLSFAQGSINEYTTPNISVLIALHACDTATDDAIYKGIKAGAQLIVVAPCCHKQIRIAMEKSTTTNELDTLLKHGIFMERQAEMITDTLRGLLLEYSGYTTKIMQFISDAHTPKNIMIVAEKKSKTDAQLNEILNKIIALKNYFGIDIHYLEQLLELNKTQAIFNTNL
jgi:protein-L-isoaspartate O-methyltransferase